MTPDALAALAGFAFVMTLTPGPNNMMLLASGANHGLRRTVPHMAGIWLGLGAMLAAAGLGLGRVFETWPGLHGGLRWVASAYLLWLAWKIAHAASPRAGAARQPLSTAEAALFQWVNPKAWAMALTTATVYLPAPGLAGLAAAIALFIAVAVLCNTGWTLAGQGVARLLTSDPRRRLFNWAMAGLLVLSLWPILV